ncbi:MAG: hypothetical protein CW338_09315 [Clostridiales bacterium]|nr:hypothetical protein [Clostridiales bacterium]
MQLSQSDNPRVDRKKLIIAALIALVMLAAAIFLLVRVFSSASISVSVTALRCTSDQDVTPFGENLLYYDGLDLYCLNSKGSEKWHYTVGGGAKFHAGDKYVVAWTGTKLVILNKDGKATYDNQMTESIQFARAGDTYIAIVLGEDISPTLIMKNMQGLTVDTESTAFVDTLILDVGFFADGEYLWATALDVYGSVPEITMFTFRVNQLTTGDVSLGENLVYKIIYANEKLHVISTRLLRKYDYRGVKQDGADQLVYGWQLIAHHIDGGKLRMLYARNDQTAEMELTDLRYLDDTTDKRYTLPGICYGACVYKKRIMAFSDSKLYLSDISSNRFSAVSLSEVEGGVTSYIGMLSNGTVLLAGGNKVYAVALR